MQFDRRPVGILSSKSVSTFTGIFGTLLSGRAYVPLNPLNPIERLIKIFKTVELNTIILSNECAKIFEELGKCVTKINVICPIRTDELIKVASKFSNHNFIFLSLSSKSQPFIAEVSAEDPAYIMFTSGTTGYPKGIMIRHRNVCAYMDYFINTYNFQSSDRHSNTHDISFDVSVHDIFVSALTGGCLYVLSKEELISPVEVINKYELTIWSSVPSLAMLASTLKLLKPSNMPSLRYSFFCGEALQLSTAKNWQEAADNSVVVNVYGPTEATISILGYIFDRSITPEISINGMVPIGLPYSGHSAIIIGEDLLEINAVETGELCIAGPQIASGYYKNCPETKEKFIELTNKPGLIFYRTGDLAKKIDNDIFVFLGRRDDQIKLNGYRIEIAEIEKVLRDITQNQMSICVPVSTDLNLGVIDEIHAYIEGEADDYQYEAIFERFSEILPKYMIPSSIHFIEKMPLNLNGKIDKKNIVELFNKKESEKLNKKMKESTSSKSVQTQSYNIKEVGNKDGEKNEVHIPINRFRCARCFKDLNEDKSFRGFGLIKIVNSEGKDDFVCNVCLMGF
jgi:amino acid adenylation domain-containing protein